MSGKIQGSYVVKVISELDFETCLVSPPTKMQGKGILGRENIWSKERAVATYTVCHSFGQNIRCVRTGGPH